VKQPELLKLRFGLFDDSFLAKEHPKVNAVNWRASVAIDIKRIHAAESLVTTTITTKRKL